MLTDAEAGLLLDPNFGTVTTLRADGSLHTTVVWLDWDGERVVFNTREERAKAKHLKKDPRVSINVIDPSNPYRWLSISGVAELDPIGAKNHMDKLSEKYRGRPYDHPPDQQRVIVRVTPQRVVSYGLR